MNKIFQHLPGDVVFLRVVVAVVVVVEAVEVVEIIVVAGADNAGIGKPQSTPQ